MVLSGGVFGFSLLFRGEGIIIRAVGLETGQDWVNRFGGGARWRIIINLGHGNGDRGTIRGWGGGTKVLRDLLFVERSLTGFKLFLQIIFTIINNL